MFKANLVKFPVAQAPLSWQDMTRVNFGWWEFFPPGVEDWWKNTLGTHPDMCDFACSQCPAWDCPATVIMDLENLEKHPHADDCLEVMRRWEDVRVRKILTPAQKKMLKDTTKEFHLHLEPDGSYALYPFEMLPASAGAPAIRAYLFERHGKRVIAYWHTTGSGTLTLSVGQGGTPISLPCDRLRYWETDLPAKTVRSVWTEARLSFEKGQR